MMIYFEISFIVLIVVLQSWAFSDVRSKIQDLRSFFPKNFNDLEVIKYHVPKGLLKNNVEFASFISGISKGNPTTIGDDATEKEEVEVLVIDKITRQKHWEFNEVILSTNAYLCKNKGASADFNILQDICDRHIQRLDNSISNRINVPLYIGLGGTFLGIIIGLGFLAFKGVDTKSITELITSVIMAMIASLAGLILTTWNTAKTYQPAVYQNDTDKNHYYDFIQRELLPVLNIGMAGSLSSFREILSDFVVKFGGDTVRTAQLLNENLSKQQFVLEEINKLDIPKTSNAIVESFFNLKNSSEQLKMFLNYQVSLNQNVTETNKVVGGLNDTLNSFKSFNSNLEAIAKNVNSSIELQRQFKDMLELHFPTIKDHREVWRGQVDELNTDIKGIYVELNKYFQESTSIIQTFVQNNESYFTGLNDIQKVIKIFVDSAKFQTEQFMALNTGMLEMRQDLRQSQQSNYELNKELVEAVKNLTLKISRLEIITTPETDDGKK
ncbi:MAG: hypothetical protein IPM47_07465 [Sphingobacteriales bacterium]|nr:MAG: hypothetical protein IPM47_07465 [Sphingobacteriales bacterium]